MQSTEERLSQCLTAVAERTTADQDWRRVVRAAHDRPQESAAPRILAYAAAIVFVLAAGALIVSRRSAPTRIDAVDSNQYVLPGETLVSVEPLTVTPAPAPLAQIDPNELGDEIVVEPLTQTDDKVQSLIASHVGTSPDRTITKVTLLGTIDGHAFVEVITDGPGTLAGRTDNLRDRWFIGPGGGSASGDFVDPDTTDFMGSAIDPSSSGPSYSTPVGDVVWNVRDETAIVTFESDDTRAWIRPVGGYAIFPTEFDTGERFTLRALDINGEVIDQTSVTTEDSTDSSIGPQIGDRFDRIEVTELDGNQFQIEPDGNPTVLLYGADWCAPCQAIQDQTLPLIETIDPNVSVLLVPTYTSPGETWNLGPEWDQPQIQIPTDLSGIQQVPTIIILDGNNTIVSVSIGVDGVIEALASLENLPTN